MELDLPAPDQRQGQVGERRQVTGRTQAPLFGHDRVDPGGQHGQQPIDDERPATAVPQGERVGPEQQHRPDDLARERRPDAGGVAHQEVLLELPRLGRLDERGREVAEAGRHAVHDGTLGDERLDDVTRLLHPLPRARVELDRRAAAGDGLHVGDREVRAGQDDLRFGHVAEDSRLCSRPCSTS